MAERVRWTCAEGHRGCLAPARMRLNDWRRVCAACSKAAGVIVYRFAPAVLRKRALKLEAAARKRRRSTAAAGRRREALREREFARAAARRAALVDGPCGDLSAELVRLWALACELSPRDDLDSRTPPVFVQRVGDHDHVTGHSSYDGSRIVVTIGGRSDPAEGLTVLAHEVSHAVGAPGEGHGAGFWRLHCDLVGIAYDAHPNITNQTTGYGRHLVIAEAVRVARRKEGALNHGYNHLRRENRRVAVAPRRGASGTVSYSVKLLRGPLGTKEYSNATRTGAERRARALADLHGVEATSTSGGWVVDAAGAYHAVAARPRRSGGKSTGHT